MVPFSFSYFILGNWVNLNLSLKREMAETILCLRDFAGNFPPMFFVLNDRKVLRGGGGGTNGLRI